MDNIYKYMEEKRYMTPAVLELEFYSDAVLCQSTIEEVEFDDGEW